MKDEEEHGFTLTVDIVKMDPTSDRVKISGFLGKELDIKMNEDRLELIGDEASISVAMNSQIFKRLLEAS